MTRVFLGLGANVGNREENLRMALQFISARCASWGVSSLYGSAAVVADGDTPGPEYRNAVCEIETVLSAEDLLAFVKNVEHAIGRRPAVRWAPRPIDIDILLFGDAIINTPELVVPHSRIAERNFVLVPLAELASDVLHPALGRTIGELAEDIDLDGLEHLSGPDWVLGSSR